MAISSGNRKLGPVQKQVLRPVAGVVVTFFPDDGLVDRLLVLAGQVDLLIVVDNGSSGRAWEGVLRAVRATGATLVVNGTNRGLATALNQGAAQAMDSGCRWLLISRGGTGCCGGPSPRVTMAGSLQR